MNDKYSAKPIEIAENIYSVGKIDWAIKSFHSYELSTDNGSTYNSYLICGEKNILVDTVKIDYRKELLDNISKIIPPSEIDYVIINHCEPDHAGSLSFIMNHCPNATLIISQKGAESVAKFHPASETWQKIIVKTGDSFKLGNKKVTFFEARMLHWPDTMFTYLEPENILFTTDAFGQHFASEFRFDDEVDQGRLAFETLKYFVNIINPYSSQVINKIAELKNQNWKFNLIAPSHGIIWRRNPEEILNKYELWANNPLKKEL